MSEFNRSWTDGVLSFGQAKLRKWFANSPKQSVPKVRVYFEKVAAGFSPAPIITKWYPFDD